MTVKDKVGIGAQMALQIIEEGKRPMSVDQIKAKYQLNFPFVIKLVHKVRAQNQITGAPSIRVEAGRRLVVVSFNHLLNVYDTDEDFVLIPTKEQFVYVDGGVS